MARPSYPTHSGPLPPPLPPESRTVGQLIAESIAVYRRAPWAALRVGAVYAAAVALASELDERAGFVPAVLVLAAAMSVAFVLASALVHIRPLGRPAVAAVAVGLVAFVPFTLLRSTFLVLGLVWLAIVALAVPAALVERLGPGAALARGVALARADFAHALGGIAALVLVVFLTWVIVGFLLQEVADNTLRVAAFLATLAVAPLPFIGGALLYDDQVARIGLTREERRALRHNRGTPAA